MKNKILIAIILAFFLGYFFLYKDGVNLGNVNPKPVYKTVHVQRGDFKVKVSATGIVEPDSQVEIKSKASGQILKFSFNEGDYIKKGHLLIKLDKSDEQRNVNKAMADVQSASARLKTAVTNLTLQKNKYATDLKTSKSNLESSEASLKESEYKLKRQRDLFKQKVSSREALDSAETNYKIIQENFVQAEAQLIGARNSKYDISLRENDIELAKADMIRAEIALEEAEERLDETEIFAPMDGVLITKSVEEGQIISSGISNVSGGTALCLIADISRLFILADIDETDIGSVNIGQKVSITTDAYPNEIFQGKVRRIAPQGQIESNITIFKVKIEIIGSGINVLKPMMTANVEIISSHVKNALYVAREAINKSGNSFYVVLLKGKNTQEINISKGIQNPIYAQIKSGVKENDKLVAGNWEKIQTLKKKDYKKKSTLRKMLWFLRPK
tara:strand:- start:1401 stop:2735 length:1335 start_codon:yes stop_codon:yes gene_type:complete